MGDAQTVLNADMTAPVSGSKESGAERDPLPSFKGGIEPTKVSMGYTIGMAVVAVGMLLLSGAYIGLIGLAGYGSWYHLAHNGFLFAGSGGNLFKLIAYVGPAVAGGTLIFFMIKPFFTSRGREPARYSLTRESDPALFAFIAKICETVKAPLPSRVDVDCQVNASASFRRGLLSLAGNDLTLTIGLPLAQAMTMQEFGGVLAHEFGHFAQGAGMRLTYVIRTINNWFAQLVYGRDEWDIKLARAASGIDFRIGILLHFTRLSIWFTRRILWVLMHLGHAMSCFMMRQMEYDADSYEAKVAGSAAFAETAAKLHNLSAASGWAHHQMRESWQNQRLPENLPRFINFSSSNLPPKLKQQMDEAQAKRKTRLFDTHPCNADRVRAAQAIQQPGVFHSDAPAAGLFNDFEGLSETVTRFYYQDELGLKISDKNLVSHEAAIKESESKAAVMRSEASFFFGLQLVDRQLLLSEPDADTAGLITELKAARTGMEASHKEVAVALKQFAEAEGLYQRGLNALNQSNQEATRKATVTMQGLVPILSAFEQLAQKRLSCALALLKHPEIAAKLPDANALQMEAARLGVVFGGLGRALGPLQELRRYHGALFAMLELRPTAKYPERIEERISELTPQLESFLKAARIQLEGLHHPFPDGRADVLLTDFARNANSGSHPLATLFNNCACHLERLPPLYQRVLGRLTFIACKVEEQI
jgi:hypothetical protein